MPSKMLKQKNILIMGMGASGESAFQLLDYIGIENLYLSNRGAFDNWGAISSTILNSKGSTWTLKHCFNEDSIPKSIFETGIDFVILSPGIPRDNKILNLYKSFIKNIISEIELASLFFKNTPIIGITGTNGKTTTVSLLGEILKSHFENVFVGGNIGVPFCEAALKKMKGENFDIILLELSSFQLESTPTFRLNFAGILNLTQNHGERYENIDDYADAKLNIQNRMERGDILFLPMNDDITKRYAKKYQSKIKNPKYQIQKINTHDENEMKKEITACGVDLDKIKIKGNHNLKNIIFAIKMAQAALNIYKESSQAISNQKIATAIHNFKGVPHRLEWFPLEYPVEYPVEYKVACKNIEFFNDAKSTNADATITAVNALKRENGNIILLYGGQKRGENNSLFNIKEVLDDIHYLLLYGETAGEHLYEIQKSDNDILIAKTKKFKNIKEALEFIKEIDINCNTRVLLSPGFPSFDQFKNYEERGDYFKKYVKEIFN